MKQTFAKFLETTNRDTYFALRDLVMADPQFNPYSTELQELNTLCEERRFDEVQQRLPTLLPNCLLSPSFHMFASMAAEELEDKHTARLEAAVAQKCLKALLTTGDGSKDRPYHIIRLEDEYDLMAYHKRPVASQFTVERDSRYLDVLQSQGGVETWFDVTLPRSFLNRQTA